MRVELRRQRNGRDRRYLGAVIKDLRGDLVLEGQDLGPATGFISPRGEYEYWVTIGAEHRDTVLVMLVTERFSGDAGTVRPWLKANGFRFRGIGRGDIEQVPWPTTLRSTAAASRKAQRSQTLWRLWPLRLTVSGSKRRECPTPGITPRGVRARRAGGLSVPLPGHEGDDAGRQGVQLLVIIEHGIEDEHIRSR